MLNAENAYRVDDGDEMFGDIYRYQLIPCMCDIFNRIGQSCCGLMVDNLL